jgi:hypothetical protein
MNIILLFLKSKRYAILATFISSFTGLHWYCTWSCNKTYQLIMHAEERYRHKKDFWTLIIASILRHLKPTKVLVISTERFFIIINKYIYIFNKYIYIYIIYDILVVTQTFWWAGYKEGPGGLWLNVHCKKRLANFPSPDGRSLSKLTLPGRE